MFGARTITQLEYDRHAEALAIEEADRGAWQSAMEAAAEISDRRRALGLIKDIARIYRLRPCEACNAGISGGDCGVCGGPGWLAR